MPRAGGHTDQIVALAPRHVDLAIDAQIEHGRSLDEGSHLIVIVRVFIQKLCPHLRVVGKTARHIH